MSCCNCIPTYNVSSIAVDSTTNIATFTVSATSLSSGYFNLKFNICCQKFTCCSTATINLVVGTTTYSTVLGRNGNYVTLGQLSNQINRIKMVHMNLTSNPAGNIMVMDKLPTCTASTVVGNSSTVVTVS